MSCSLQYRRLRTTSRGQGVRCDTVPYISIRANTAFRPSLNIQGTEVRLNSHANGKPLDLSVPEGVFELNSNGYGNDECH
jgi:hypothetical protein